MALRDQPYLPLYVQDFLTDEKLADCSAQSTGVYIRLMCLMHKSAQYGCILLKQKDKQNESKILNFAVKMSRQMPYTVDVIAAALEELLDENVIQIEGDVLSQKRMVQDAKISDTRASAGKKRKKAEKKSTDDDFASDFASDFAIAKTQANAENEIEYENETENEDEDKNVTAEKSSEEKQPKVVFPHDSHAYLLAAYLSDRITERCPTVKPPGEKKLQQWADAFDKCHRLDGHDWNEIKYVLKFSQKDAFWQANILSGRKFREKYVQLLSKMQQWAKGKGQGGGSAYISGADRLLTMLERGEFDEQD